MGSIKMFGKPITEKSVQKFLIKNKESNFKIKAGNYYGSGIRIISLDFKPNLAFVINEDAQGCESSITYDLEKLTNEMAYDMRYSSYLKNYSPVTQNPHVYISNSSNMHNDKEIEIHNTGDSQRISYIAIGLNEGE